MNMDRKDLEKDSRGRSSRVSFEMIGGGGGGGGGKVGHTKTKKRGRKKVRSGEDRCGEVENR